jgi:AraC-like DNA-binding protein
MKMHLPMQPKTRQELANDLGISARTLSRRLKLFSIKIPKGLISPENQEEILNKLGYNKLISEYNYLTTSPQSDSARPD